MVMPGDNLKFEVTLISPIAMEEKLRFAIREGGRTVGAGVVSEDPEKRKGPADGLVGGTIRQVRGRAVPSRAGPACRHRRRSALSAIDLGCGPGLDRAPFQARFPERRGHRHRQLSRHVAAARLQFARLEFCIADIAAWNRG